jgi:hypothetical protein
LILLESLMKSVGLKSGVEAGSSLMIARKGYRHYGIYVGGGRVIHYAGRLSYPEGRVEEISLEEFGGQRPVHVGVAPDCAVASEVVRRARSRLGECRYDLLRNNCEHFSNWCQLGEARSEQVEALTTPMRILVRAASALVVLGLFVRWKIAPSDPVAFGDALPGERWREFLLELADQRQSLE